MARFRWMPESPGHTLSVGPRLVRKGEYIELASVHPRLLISGLVPADPAPVAPSPSPAPVVGQPDAPPVSAPSAPPEPEPAPAAAEPEVAAPSTPPQPQEEAAKPKKRGKKRAD